MKPPFLISKLEELVLIGLFSLHLSRTDIDGLYVLQQAQYGVLTVTCYIRTNRPLRLGGKKPTTTIRITILH